MENKNKIIGNIVGVPNPKSDWSQNDETKADYIKNKPPLDVYANALKGNVSGEFVSIADISPIEHNLGIKVWCKNLFNPKAELMAIPSELYKGVDITDLVNTYGGSSVYMSMKLKEGKTIPTGISFGFGWLGSNGSVSAIWFLQGGKLLLASTACKTALNATNICVCIYPAKQESWDAVMDAFDIQLEIGTKASEYTPYVKPEDVKVQVFGKNLIPYPFLNFTTASGGITATDLGDGGVLLNGTASTTVFIHLHKTNIGPLYIEGARTFDIGTTKCTITANKYSDAIRTIHHNNNHLTYIIIDAGTVCDNIVFYPQIEVGSVVTEFERGVPYKSLTPNADGSVDGIESVSPCMNIFCNTEGVTLDVAYNKDVNKVIETLTNAIISLGGNV